MRLSFGSVVGAPVGDSLVGALVGATEGDTAVWLLVTCVGGFPGVGRHLGPQRCGWHGRSPADYNTNLNNSLNIGHFANMLPFFNHSVLGRTYLLNPFQGLSSDRP